MTFTGGEADYLYLSDGTKLAALKDGSGLIYCGSMVFSCSFSGTAPAVDFESTGFSAGRMVKKDGAVQPEYHVNDYLCSVRVVTDARGEVLERNDYSGFGKRLASSAVTPAAGSANRYRFSGKEEQGFAGVPWQDFGARMYDPDLARWTTPDPLAEKYPGISPYVYCNDNPVNLVDPDGRTPETVWDILNVVYDVGAAIYNHATGDHKKARDRWKDAGYDALAVMLPGLPAGFSKIRHVDEAADALGALAKTDNVTDAAKITTKNPFGSKGKPDHQHKIQELKDKANSEMKPGERVETERIIKAEGSNRRPDVQIIDKDGRTRKIFEAERRPESKRNRLREEEYRRLNIEYETYPLK